MTGRRSIDWQQVKRDWTIRMSVAVFASLITAFVGPFGSYDLLSFSERVLYWGGMIFAFVLPGVFIRAIIIRFIPTPTVARDIGIALVQGLIFGPMGWLFSMAVTDLPLDNLQSVLEHIGIAILIMLIPAAIRYHLRAERREGEADALSAQALTLPVQTSQAVKTTRAAAPAAPEILFLDRLDDDKRGEPLRVSAADHFLSVKTPLGESRIRMRFGDALRELQTFDGVCIHRSHWVAASQIDRTEVQGRRTTLYLKDGEQLPVSATGVTALRKAGFVEF